MAGTGITLVDAPDSITVSADVDALLQVEDAPGSDGLSLIIPPEDPLAVAGKTLLRRIAVGQDMTIDAEAPGFSSDPCSNNSCSPGVSWPP